jgi:predicted secreted acid phosphatase
MKTYIFDIDNTIANNEHRIHHLLQEPKNWDQWHKEHHLDTPYWEIIDLLNMAIDNGIKIVLCTGRDSMCREDTIEWLKEHNIYYDDLYMRPLGHREDDSEVKRKLLKQIREDGYDPVLVFEDRDRVVEMWREEGLRCLQVAPGNF